MDSQQDHNKCNFCWKTLGTCNDNTSEKQQKLWISISQLSDEHLEIFKKYFEDNFEHSNPSLLFCTDCMPSIEKLSKLNAQLEEINNLVSNLVSTLKENISKSQEKCSMEGNSETAHLDCDDGDKTCNCDSEASPINSLNTLPAANFDIPETMPMESGNEVCNSTDENFKSLEHCEEVGEVSFDENIMLSKSPVKEVRVKLKRLKFKLTGNLPPPGSEAVILVESNSPCNRDSNHFGTNSVEMDETGSSEDADDDCDNGTQDLEMNGQQRSQTLFYTESYCCSRCSKSSSDRHTMEKHIKMHEKQDRQYWRKNLEFLKKTISRRRRAQIYS